MERLQKLISQAGVASRRAAERMIEEGRVTVDGVVAAIGAQADVSQTICVDGKPLRRAEAHVYFLLNKPKGYISTAKDERGRKTVLDLLPEVRERIYPVGRLDNGTEGLLLLTNDGNLMNGLLHPAREVWKTYAAQVDGILEKRELQTLKNGVALEDGVTAPAKVRVLDWDDRLGRTKLEISIHEGKNRQVRRMCEAVGHSVRSLKRTEFAGLNLSGVRRGEYRALTAEEVAYLYEVAGLPVRGGRRKGGAWEKS